MAAARPAAAAPGAADLLQQGVDLRRSGHDEAALKAFEQANQIEPSARALAQIGLAEQALGRWVPAFEHLRSALDDKGNPWIVKNRSVIERALEHVQDHVGQLEILDGPPGAEVRLAGVRRGTLPLPGPIPSNIGTISIELLAPGSAPIGRATIIRGHETTRESFQGAAPSVSKTTSLAPVTGSGTPPRAVADTGQTAVVDTPTMVRSAPVRSSPERKATPVPRWVPWVGVGATAAFFAAAVFFHVDANNHFDNLKSSCGSMAAGCTSTQIDEVKSRDRATTISSILGGAAALATGVVLFANGTF